MRNTAAWIAAATAARTRKTMSNAHAEQKHPYHLVDPSPWPVVGSVAALVLALGLLFYMHDITNWVLPLGILLLLGTMVGWWRDVVKEATFQGHHNAVVQIGMRYGMAMFIARSDQSRVGKECVRPCRS